MNTQSKEIYGEYVKPYIVYSPWGSYRGTRWGILVRINYQGQEKIVKSETLVRLHDYAYFLKPDKPFREYITQFLDIDLNKIPVIIGSEETGKEEILLEPFDKNFMNVPGKLDTFLRAFLSYLFVLFSIYLATLQGPFNPYIFMLFFFGSFVVIGIVQTIYLKLRGWA